MKLTTWPSNLWYPWCRWMKHFHDTMPCVNWSKTINLLKSTISSIRLFMDGGNSKSCFEFARYQSETMREEEGWGWRWAQGHKDGRYLDCTLEFLVQGGYWLWDSDLRFWEFRIRQRMEEYASQVAREGRNNPWGQFACTMSHFPESCCDYRRWERTHWSPFAVTTSDPWYRWD